MGIHPKVDYIRSRNCQNNFNSLEQFIDSINFSVGPLNENEIAHLTTYYHESMKMMWPLSRQRVIGRWFLGMSFLKAS